MKTTLRPAKPIGRDPHVELALLYAAYGRKPQNLHLSLGVSLVGAGLLYFLFFRSNWMFWWLGFIWAAMAVGYAEMVCFGRMPPTLSTLRRWQGVFAFQSTVAGLAWAFGGVMLLPQSLGAEPGIFVGTVLAVSAVAMNSLMEQRVAMVGFLFGAMAPTAWMLCVSGDPAQIMMGAIVLAGMVLMAVVGFDFHRSVLRHIEAQTELSAAVAAAQEAHALAESATIAKNQFLANMSHEIRTPMNAVLGMLRLLHHTPLTPQQLDYADKGEGAAKSLLRLLDDFLDFAKMDANKMQLDPQPFALQELLGDLFVILSANLNNKPTALRLDLAADVPPCLMGDAMRLLQVLVNLGGNAVKFTLVGEVVVAVKRATAAQSAFTVDADDATQNLMLTFSVRDSGIGIAPEDQARIFEGFSQAEASTTRRFGGTGLGLSISRRLVSLMGGSLSLTSTPGVGSTFSFTVNLPQATSTDTARLTAPKPGAAAPATWGEASAGSKTQSAAPAVARQRRLDQVRVLLVEDNAINQQIARELLRAEGALVTVADNGQIGVDAVMAQPSAFDVILMDVQMPVLDGFAATRAIRQARLAQDLPHLPIVAMTANAMDSDREACFAAGMDDHIGKPFDVNHLVKVVRRFARTLPAKPSAADARSRLSGVAPAALPRAVTPSVVLPQPTAQSAQPGLLATDVEQALERMGGDTEFYSEILQSFLEKLPTQMPELKALVTQQNWLAATRSVHTLKGLAAVVGALHLEAVAFSVEQTFKRWAQDSGGGPGSSQEAREQPTASVDARDSAPALAALEQAIANATTVMADVAARMNTQEP